jgi:hypothetical protein
VQIALINDQWVSFRTDVSQREKLAHDERKYLEILQQLSTPEQPTVPLAEWRQMCIANGLIEPGNKSDESKFRTYKSRLITKNWIKADADKAWPI